MPKRTLQQERDWNKIHMREFYGIITREEFDTGWYMLVRNGGRTECKYIGEKHPNREENIMMPKYGWGYRVQYQNGTSKYYRTRNELKREENITAEELNEYLGKMYGSTESERTSPTGTPAPIRGKKIYKAWRKEWEEYRQSKTYVHA